MERRSWYEESWNESIGLFEVCKIFKLAFALHFLIVRMIDTLNSFEVKWETMLTFWRDFDKIEDMHSIHIINAKNINWIKQNKVHRQIKKNNCLPLKVN